MSVRSTQTGAGRLAGLIGGVAVFALAAILAGCSPTTSSAGPGAATVARPQLVISAASSLRGVLTSVTPGFEQASGASVVVNYGATGQLLKQIEGGAPADLLLAASPSAVATLVADG
ncbi:MAG TPA: substrate-binding domain-containing protein, partial [Coriobacteriia bacterium]